jgi:hypothetical protein
LAFPQKRPDLSADSAGEIAFAGGIGAGRRDRPDRATAASLSLALSLSHFRLQGELWILGLVAVGVSQVKVDRVIRPTAVDGIL